MSRSQVDAVGLLVAVLGAAVALTLLPGPFAWLGSICGLLLVFTLLAYDGEGRRTLFESLAFSAVFALAATVAAAIPLRIMAVSQGRPAAFEGTLANEWLPLFWLGVTILLWPIDRARMSGRVQYSAEPSMAATLDQAKREAIVAAYRQTQTPVPQPAPPSMPDRTPVAPAPVRQDEPVSLLHATPPSAPVQPSPVPVPSGPETTIYVTLVGEGLNVLRGVQAEHLGRDFYKIIEPMPKGETWQYGLGQVVRCKKKNLSGGKALVAIEEAPRAQ